MTTPTAPTASQLQFPSSPAWDPPSRQSRVREVVAGTFTGTPGRLRLLGGIAIVGCLLFGAIGFAAASALHSDIESAHDDAAQLVRLQTIRTSLVKADANATNAFLVGGLEPAAVRAAYTEGIATAANSIAAASSANASDAKVLSAVNQKLTEYTGLIESARANNRQGFPVGAAYLRDATRVLQEGALLPLAALVAVQQDRVDDAANGINTNIAALVLGLAIAVAALLILQFWLYRRTRRVFNVPLVVATGVVVLLGVIALGVGSWARTSAQNALATSYRQTVAIATVRINAFDAKSAEALTLISRGSGQVYEGRFTTAADNVATALDGFQSTDAPSTITPEWRLYLKAHFDLRQLDEDGAWELAVASATGSGAANKAFAQFERSSADALSAEATGLAHDLDRLLTPLAVIAWTLLLAGVIAAGASWRGVLRRLEEYR